jgi:hypothetical protein
MAFPYFNAALNAAPTDREVAEICQHDYMVSTLSIALSAWDPSPPDLAAVRKVTFKTCWKDLSQSQERLQ